MFEFLFEYRGFIVGTIFIALIATVIWAILYGRNLIRTEKSDAVFGNPERALGGWHWVMTGVSAILIVWIYFSWDAARAFNPKAANELCQVGKLSSAINPIRSTFPLDDGFLKGTSLLVRENKQLNELADQVERLGFSDAEKSQAKETIDLMRKAIIGMTSPEYLDSATDAKFKEIVGRIDGLTAKLADQNYPGDPTAEQIAAAEKNPRWGDSGNEIPAAPASPRGYKFDAAAKEMKTITSDFSKIRNNNSNFLAQVEKLKGQIASLDTLVKASPGTDELLIANRADFVKGLTRVLRRVDDGNIFPPDALNNIQNALVKLDNEQKSQQGGLRYYDILMMPGGEIRAGSSSCSEQGSGRWLPKPSDTLRTFARISNPEIGYKGYPLLWYKMKPFGEMVDFIIPDFIASLVPGDYPRHDTNGIVTPNFKSKVRDFATGNFESFKVPMPSGHVWDSLLRVLAGLFFGIILGVPLGLFMGLSRFSKGFFDPLIELYRPVPPLAWAPLILTIFGIGDDGKIFLLFMVAFAIMVISARTGATGTHLSKIHAAHSLGATNRQILRKVILPNSLPEILTGIRIAIGVCWGTLVAAEMLAGTTGIGFVENVARKQSDYEIIWTTIIILGLLGLLFDLMMRWVIDKFIPWRGKG
ncbi:ABC transporter permease subunit [Cocleimonas sp. KMM 6892]|uniref:ABC transporter permease subunit n=1 Tax=unclassified Cocleimonas TaxID=2639732 RepID=UPI002DB705DB|nr:MULTISPECIES: ABC transporter permease subunit [unclassified Cocleimonas]MEB8431459.1 ABC transporter permease subunit [Cocleimonas sp. KMM 6892]MEC4713769.1 ABC transporter permease subunit [Cocleimonas sp. KMM 6895]MEC4743100.1 ABC transporter permease subunit [Cocleimonas sp. KMM 6896]